MLIFEYNPARDLLKEYRAKDATSKNHFPKHFLSNPKGSFKPIVKYMFSGLKVNV